jgi:hypothetical protein
MLRMITAWLIGLSLFMSAAHAETPTAKISALPSGALLLNGQPADLALIEAELKRIKSLDGAVWYYRDNPRSEPGPEANSVVQLIIQYRLPVSFSSKPDFSDYVDENGRSHPRKR